MADEKPKKVRAKRRNFAREIERVSGYLDVIIRVKDDPDGRSGMAADTAKYIDGQLKAYRDIQSFMREIQNGVK